AALAAALAAQGREEATPEAPAAAPLAPSEEGAVEDGTPSETEGEITSPAPETRHSEEPAAQPQGDEESPAAPDGEGREGDPSTRAEALAQDDAADTPPTPDYVAITLSSGIAPLEMRFAQINSCYRRLPIAYRSFTYINSVIEGVIPPEKYSYAADGTDRGEKLARWNIVQAMKAVKAFEAAGRDIEFVTARCPANLTLELDLYDWMKKLMDEHGFHSPSKLCLEFPRTLLYEDPERVRPSILGMKLLKVRTLMTGVGERDCPDTALIDVPVDMVLLSPRLSALSDSRDKSRVFSSYVAFLRALPVDVLGDGIYNDEQISAHSRADCFGYTPSAGYAGSVEHGRLRMTLDEAVSQKEDDV
ncbi:MAG: EAL domain-containing protein, partial [Clostridia bacterium]|nr:EAL domain-containing protein [Clostridia bacterium]